MAGGDAPAPSHYLQALQSTCAKGPVWTLLYGIYNMQAAAWAAAQAQALAVAVAVAVAAAASLAKGKL